MVRAASGKRGRSVTTPCPRCGGSGEAPDPLAREIERLRVHARALNIWSDGRIREGAAAELLGLRPETLRDYRKSLSPDEAPIRYMRDGRRGVWYRLDDLAAFTIGIK